MTININWRIFLVLLVLGMVSVLCVVPYIFTVQAELLKNVAQPLWIILFAQLVQSLILFCITIFFGLLFAQRLGFKLPLIEALVEKRDYKNMLEDILRTSVPLGVVIAIVIYVTDYLFSALGVMISTHKVYAPAWQTLLASVYGGITEEILMRLFLMLFFIWLGAIAFKQKEPSKIIIWLGIILASIIFGLGHLPITASLVKIDFLVVSRALILNSIGGLTFGWLFWKKGLETAMIAHFTTDIVLLTILPLLIK